MHNTNSCLKFQRFIHGQTLAQKRELYPKIDLKKLRRLTKFKNNRGRGSPPLAVVGVAGNRPLKVVGRTEKARKAKEKVL